MNIFAVINLLFGLVMVGLAIGLPLVTGRTDIGFLVGMGGLGVGGLVCLLVSLMFMKGGGKLFGNDPILATGIPATAVIRAVGDTGITLQNGLYAILKFNLEVGPPAGAPYLVNVRLTVPRIAFSMVGIGKIVAVKIDPQNRNHVAIDWNSTPQLPSPTG